MYIILSENNEDDDLTTSLPIQKIEKKEQRNIPFIFNGNFFRIKQIYENSNRVEAFCKFCNNEYRGTLSSTTNFLNHLRRTHPMKAKEYQRNMKKQLSLSISAGQSKSLKPREKRR